MGADNVTVTGHSREDGDTFAAEPEPSERPRSSAVHGELTREERIAELWSRGDLWWKLYPDQREVYDFVRGCKERIIVIEIARQFGKTFTLSLIAIEIAIRNPGWAIRFVSGDQKALRKASARTSREILSDCPRHLRPVWNSMDDVYRFPNGAEIHFASANDGQADSNRGQRAHACFVEEAGFVDDLDYLVTSVLLPQTKTTGGQIIMISTPRVTPAHAWETFCVRTKSTGSHILRTIEDDKHTSEKEKEILIREMGGRESSRARRELWCEHIVDETRAVCPEFDRERAARLVYDAPPPTYEQPLVALDLGWADKTGVLFGYYDFRRAKLVIQDELLLTRNRTDELVAKSKAVESRLWPEPRRREPNRVCDAPLLVVNDISVFHKWPVAAPMKDDLDAMVNELRLWTQADRLHIDPRCRGLVAQLQAAIWDSARKKFERTTEGHSDLVAALIYMIRSASVFENPYPVLQEGISQQTHQIDPALLGSQPGGSAKQLAKLFGRANVMAPRKRPQQSLDDRANYDAQRRTFEGASDIKTQPTSQEYRDGWERIFGKPKQQREA